MIIKITDAYNDDKLIHIMIFVCLCLPLNKLYFKIFGEVIAANLTYYFTYRNFQLASLYIGWRIGFFVYWMNKELLCDGKKFQVNIR